MWPFKPRPNHRKALGISGDTYKAPEPPPPTPAPRRNIVEECRDIGQENLTSLRLTESYLVEQIARDAEELRLTRIAIAASDASLARLEDLKDISAFELSEINFLIGLDPELTDCIGLDRERLALAKSLRDRGLVTIEDSHAGPLVGLTPAGAYARNVRPIVRLASTAERPLIEPEPAENIHPIEIAGVATREQAERIARPRVPGKRVVGKAPVS